MTAGPLWNKQAMLGFSDLRPNSTSVLKPWQAVYTLAADYSRTSDEAKQTGPAQNKKGENEARLSTSSLYL